MKKDISLMSLAVLSVMILPSLIISSKVAAIVLFLYIINVGWCMHKMLALRNIKLVDMARHVTDESESALKQKQYVKGGVYGLLIPMVSIGAIVLFANLVVLWLI